MIAGGPNTKNCNQIGQSSTFGRFIMILANDVRPTTGFLVELTGIEPVASWLQTRRSPS